jgi:hypothetical protein
MDERISNVHYSGERESITFSLERDSAVYVVPREVLNDLNGSNSSGEALMEEFERASSHIADRAPRVRPSDEGVAVLTSAILAPGYRP